MKPVDYRNETWRDIEARVTGLRREVYEALRVHGPCTTRDLALRCRIDLLTVRPRVTELCELDLAEVVDGKGGEGVYAARSVEDAASDFFAKWHAAHETQLTLGL